MSCHKPTKLLDGCYMTLSSNWESVIYSLGSTRFNGLNQDGLQLLGIDKHLHDVTPLIFELSYPTTWDGVTEHHDTFVTDLFLDTIVYPFNTINLISSVNLHFMQFTSQHGFTNRLLCHSVYLLEFYGRSKYFLQGGTDQDTLIQSIDPDHCYFEGLKYRIDTDSYLVLWGS